MIALTPVAEPLLYTRRQVAGMLGLCEKTIWQLSRDGKLPVVHVTSRAIRYDRRDIERFVENSKGKENRP